MIKQNLSGIKTSIVSACVKTGRNPQEITLVAVSKGRSVDSLRLAAEINRQSEKVKKIQDILVEVNISADASRFGVKPEQAEEVIKEMSEFKNLNIKGLMGISPVVDDPEKTRPYFRMLKDLQAKICGLRVTGCGLRVLSMGMSSDFEIAIEEGSNMLRLGRIVFEGLN